MITQRNTTMLTSELYSYGPDNLRVWRRKTNGAEEVMLYGLRGERLGTLQPSFTNHDVLTGASSSLVYFAGRPLSYGADRLGSKRADSPNAQGQTISYNYFPYGEEYTTTTQDTEKFGTYYRDSTTALDFARNRVYSNRLARFLTADPYRNSAGPTDPGSWNRYAYVGNDPVNFNDPGGLDRWLIIDGVCEVGAGLENSPRENVACLNFTIWSPVTAYRPPSGGGAGSPRNRGLLEDAVQRAIKALRDNQDCMDLFGNAKTRQGRFDPVNVLTNIENGTAFGKIQFKDLGSNGPEAKVTSNGLPKLAATATITINTYSEPSHLYWNSGNTDFNAETLLHEMGHLYNLVRGSGNSAIKPPDDLFGDKNSRYNDWLVDTKCFGGEFGFKNPYAEP